MTEATSLESLLTASHRARTASGRPGAYHWLSKSASRTVALTCCSPGFPSASVPWSSDT